MASEGRPNAGVASKPQDELLLTAARRCAHALNANDISAILTDAAVSLTSADGGFAAIRHDNSFQCHGYLYLGEMVPWVHSWKDPDVFRVQAPDGLLRDSILPSDLRGRLGARLALGVPIISPGRKLIGLVQVHRANGEWDQKDIEGLRALADMVLPAMQNVLAQEQLQEAEASLESLRVRMGQAFEQQQVLSRILEQQDGLSSLLGAPGQRTGADHALLDYLRRSREQLAAILQGIDEGILVEDVGGRLVHVNDAAVDILGFTSHADVLGLTLEDLLARIEVLDEQGREVQAHELSGGAALGDYSKMEARLQIRPRAGGLERTVRLRTTPITDEDSRPRFAVTIFSDITERLKMEQMREQFLSMVTHELRSPLAVIKLGISLVREDPKADLRAAMQVLTDIDGQADRLLMLIGNLLDMAQVEAGTFSVVLSVNPLSDAIEEAFARLPQPVAGETKVTVPPDMPALRIDIQRMAQVLVNLLSNAYKFSAEGEPVCLQVMREERHVTVAVSNKGPGIPDDQVHLLFRKFSKIGQRNSGTGLGLAISKHIVEAHAGRIWVETSPQDQLTTFKFSLPVP